MKSTDTRNGSIKGAQDRFWAEIDHQGERASEIADRINRDPEFLLSIVHRIFDRMAQVLYLESSGVNCKIYRVIKNATFAEMFSAIDDHVNRLWLREKDIDYVFGNSRGVIKKSACTRLLFLGRVDEKKESTADNLYVGSARIRTSGTIEEVEVRRPFTDDTVWVLQEKTGLIVNPDEV